MIIGTGTAYYVSKNGQLQQVSVISTGDSLAVVALGDGSTQSVSKFDLFNTYAAARFASTNRSKTPTSKDKVSFITNPK